MPQLIWCSHPLSPPPCGVSSPSNTIPPVHPAANGDLEISGVQITWPSFIHQPWFRWDFGCHVVCRSQLPLGGVCPPPPPPPPPPSPPTHTLNLHKTFCIPHEGGGPGMGPRNGTHWSVNTYIVQYHTMTPSLYRESHLALPSPPTPAPTP